MRDSIEGGTGTRPVDVTSVLVRLQSVCADLSAFRPFDIIVSAGAFPSERKYPLGRPFERFNEGWGSEKVDAELGKTWSQLPPAVETELRYPVGEYGLLYLRLSLRRDLAAWHQDPVGLNWPTGQGEVDLNEPSLGYFHFENSTVALTLGRFPVHWSPSPEFGLALSNSVPYHNGVEFAFKLPHARYRLLVSSLNPWLEGTPAGDSASTDYPVGSEAYLQSHYPDRYQSNNAHKRVYDEHIKTLFAHRLEGEMGPLALGLTETEIIGGKVPDLRDGNPFAFYHDDFKDGYTNIALSFDGLLRLPAGFSLGGELYLDDVQYTPTEGTGGTPSLLGYLGVLRHEGALRGWSISQSLHAIRTDPFLYGYLQPLNTMASRQILTSNYYGPGGKMVVDKYVIDYPIGYIRGGDALDFWYRMEARKDSLTLGLSVARLSKGEVDLYKPYDQYYSASHVSPSGIAEEETRVRLDLSLRLRHGLGIRGGAAWQGIVNQGHLRGVDANRAQGEAGMSWRWP